MEHWNVLSTEEKNSVLKFQEYNHSVTVNYGNKANWADLVHTDAYSDEALNNKLVELRNKLGKENEIMDEELQTPGFNVMSKTRSGSGEVITFTTSDHLNFIRAARRVRKYFKDLEAVKAEEANLQKEIEKLERRLLSPEEKLNAAKARLSQIRNNGQASVEEVKTS